MKKCKKILSVLLVSVLIVTSSFCFSTFFSYAKTYDNGIDEAVTIELDLSLSADTCTITYKNGKYFYVNAKGKINKKTGWKVNSKGAYKYYVCNKGYVKYKIASGNLYRWMSGAWNKVTVDFSNYKNIIKISNKYFYVNSKGRIISKKGWKKDSSGNYAYYVCKKGYAKYKISDGILYKWNVSSNKWVVISLTKNSNKTIGGRTFYTDSLGKIKSSKAASSSSGSGSSSSSDDNDSSDSSSSDDTDSSDDVSEETLASYAQEVVDLVNDERASEGLSELTINEELMKNAATRAEEIVTSFSHTRPDGTECFTVVTSVEYYALGENIAYTAKGSASHVMDLWMNSEGHKANILGTYYNSIGVGVYCVNGVYYWVQIFAYIP